MQTLFPSLESGRLPLIPEGPDKSEDMSPLLERLPHFSSTASFFPPSKKRRAISLLENSHEAQLIPLKLLIQDLGKQIDENQYPHLSAELCLLTEETTRLVLTNPNHLVEYLSGTKERLINLLVNLKPQDLRNIIIHYYQRPIGFNCLIEWAAFRQLAHQIQTQQTGDCVSDLIQLVSYTQACLAAHHLDMALKLMLEFPSLDHKTVLMYNDEGFKRIIAYCHQNQQFEKCLSLIQQALEAIPLLEGLERPEKFVTYQYQLKQLLQFTTLIVLQENEHSHYLLEEFIQVLEIIYQKNNISHISHTLQILVRELLATYQFDKALVLIKRLSNPTRDLLFYLFIRYATGQLQASIPLHKHLLYQQKLQFIQHHVQALAEVCLLVRTRDIRHKICSFILMLWIDQHKQEEAEKFINALEGDQRIEWQREWQSIQEQIHLIGIFNGKKLLRSD